MAKKRSRTVSKKKRNTGRGYFSPNVYNNPFYDYLRYRRKHKEVVFLAAMTSLMLAGTPSTKPLNI